MLTTPDQAYKLAVKSKDIEELGAASSCCHLRSQAALETDDAKSALEIAEHGLCLNPENYSLVWMKGRAQLALGQADNAIETVTPLTLIDPNTLVHAMQSFKSSLFGDDAYALLGAAHFELGRYKEAATLFTKVEETAENKLELKTKRELCAVLASRPRRCQKKIEIGFKLA